jgi:SAM-dependent methyltransferase
MPDEYIAHPPVSADDPAYRAAAAAEAQFWASPGTLSLLDAWYAAASGPIKRYYNRRFTGDENIPWFETVARRGPFRRGLVLGCGGLSQEQSLVASLPGVPLTFCDIDEAGLDRRRRTLDPQGSGDISTAVTDLNFAEFPPDTYDLVVSVATLHHIVNLEHVAAQVQRTLTPDGWFFLYDYTGSSGMRFPTEQKRVFELVLERERARNPRLSPVTWHDAGDDIYSPFEGIRAGETIGILGQHLAEVERYTAGPIVGLLFFAGLLDAGYTPRPRTLGARVAERLRRGSPPPPPLIWEAILSPACVRELILMDEVVCDAEMFLPNNTYAVYRKRS